ncbi:MAG: peptide chain release factor-like protein [Planctomycetota bacterium]
MHPARKPIETLLEECEFQRTRRGGPGGQHRNKVSSAIVVTHRPTGVTGQASERRSQHANRTVAIHRLRINLALEARPPGNDGTRPSELWQSRTPGGRVKVNPDHSDFPALLAEALEEIHQLKFDVAASAGNLGVSTSQLIKFLKLEPSAFALVNRKREAAGLGKLK